MNKVPASEINTLTDTERKSLFFAGLLLYYISERYPSYREKLSVSIKQKKAYEVLTRSKEVFAWLQSLQK